MSVTFNNSHGLIFAICFLRLLCANYWLSCFRFTIFKKGRFQLPRDLRRGCAAARLQRLWVRIPPGHRCLSVVECCVLSVKGLFDKLMTRPEESYRLWCVGACDLETSWIRRPWPTGGCRAKYKQIFKKEWIWMKIISTLVYWSAE